MTRNERRLKRRNTQLFLASILVLLVFLVCFVLAIKVQAKTEQTEAQRQEIIPTQRIVIPIGGNVPAQEPEIYEENENELIEAALLEQGNRIDNVKVTHYCTCSKCCGKWANGKTASGKYAVPYITIAVDPQVIPLGADVLIDYGDGEIHYCKAEDTGGSIKGNRIDLCVSTHEEAIQLGIKTATVWWVKS